MRGEEMTQGREAEQVGATSRRTEPVSIAVDGVPLIVERGTLLLTALSKQGIDVPNLCHDERLAPAGVCRLCVVEVEGVEHPVLSCTAVVTEGMVVRTRTPALAERRRMDLEMHAQRYPRGMAARFPDKPLHRYMLEHDIDGRADPSDVSIPPDHSHPYIDVDMARCIDCLRCVRICDDVQGQFVWHILDRGDGTRIVPDSGTSLLSSQCVSCGACADTCPSGAIQDKSVLLHGLPDSVTRTTCPYCGTGCEMEVGVRKGEIVSSRPVLDAPVSKGHLCVKGRYAFDFVHSPDRVTEPMIRRDGQWAAVSWDEALDFVATTLGRIRKEEGPDRIGVLGSARATNEDNYVTQKFARVVLGTNNVDCCARVCHAPTAAAMNRMLGAGAATNSFDDIERASMILVCGANPTENHPIVGARIKQVVLRGTPLVVIDPRRTELAKLATFHLRLRAGSNIPLLNSLAHVIVSETLHDRAFVRDRVADTEEYFSFLRQFSPENTASITGVEPSVVRAAARAYATTTPGMIFHGLGVTEHTQGTDGVMCLVNLALLTGNFGKPGAGVNPLRGQNNVQGSAHMGCEPSHLTGYADISVAREMFGRIWGTPLPDSPGKNLMKMLDAASVGELRALFAIGYDILLTNPNAHATERALEGLELLVVQDMFLNETARRHAHVFLPATSSFEKDGTFMNAERRVQRVRKALPALGNSRADWEIVVALAERMGRKDAFSFRSPEDIWNEVRAVWPAGRGITYERLERGGLQWPCPTEDHPGTRILHQNRFAGRERTALECVPFLPAQEFADDSYPLILITGRTLHQFNAGTMTMRTPNTILRPRDVLEMASEDARSLALVDGDEVRVTSRYGEAVLPVAITDNLQTGEVFATFHTVRTFLNRVTGSCRDRITDTPEYKVTAVRVAAVDSGRMPSSSRTRTGGGAHSLRDGREQ